MVVARRLQHLTELLCDGRRLSAHFSVNPDTRSEKVKLIVRRREQVGNPGESFLLLAVLEYLMRAEPELVITDRGHTHSDGTSEACLYMEHPLANCHGPERQAAKPRAADPHELAAPPADQPQAPEPHPAGLNTPDSDNMDTCPVRDVQTAEPLPDSAGPLQQRALQRRVSFHEGVDTDELRRALPLQLEPPPREDHLSEIDGMSDAGCSATVLAEQGIACCYDGPCTHWETKQMLRRWVDSLEYEARRSPQVLRELSRHHAVIIGSESQKQGQGDAGWSDGLDGGASPQAPGGGMTALRGSHRHGQGEAGWSDGLDGGASKRAPGGCPTALRGSRRHGQGESGW